MSHGSRNPCLLCSAAAGQKIHCNQIRGPMSVRRAQRIITERIAAHAKAKPVTPPKPEFQGGRDW